jgi:hypothetical protein
MTAMNTVDTRSTHLVWVWPYLLFGCGLLPGGESTYKAWKTLQAGASDTRALKRAQVVSVLGLIAGDQAQALGPSLSIDRTQIVPTHQQGIKADSRLPRDVGDDIYVAG